MKTNGSGYYFRVTGVNFTPRIFRFILPILLFSFLCNMPLQAAYLKNVPQTITQPDGTTFRCFATGDEYHHWLHDANNFTILQDSVTGYFVYAIKSGTRLVPSSLIAGVADPAGMGLQPGLNLDERVVQARSETMFRIPAFKGSSGVMTTGTINNIVIFIRFNDQAEYTDAITRYSLAFNSTGTASMVQYFKEITGSQLTINTSLYPKTGGATVVSYQDSKDRKYYCKFNSVTNPTGYLNETERSDREMALLKNATEALKLQIESTGLNYDNDGNGQVDNVCYIIQGSTDGWAELLWPHMWALYSHNVTIGNARVWNYNFQISETFGVNVLCHEMSHSLGFPDLYRYSNRTINPVGPWDVMSSTTNPPQHPGVYMKQKYGGWIADLPEISTNGTFSLKPLSSDPFAGYKISSPNSTSEYFIVEYRKTTGIFESQLLGSGLIIYRVNPSINGNGYGPQDEVYVCRPGGTTTVDGNLAQANFSSDEGRTSFGGTSNTGCFLSDGSPGGFQITNIGTAGETISFTVNFGNSSPPVLNLAPTSRELAVNAGTASFTVSNTGEGTMNWTAAVTTGNNWLHITSGSNGINSGSILVAADANTESSTRTAVITVTASDAAASPKLITILQAAAKPAVLSVLPADRSIESAGGSISYEVTNTGGGSMSWTASLNNAPSWCRISSGTSGINNGNINVSVDANPGNTERTGTITVTAGGVTGGTRRVTFTQAAQHPVLNVLPDTRSIGYEQSTTFFDIDNSGTGEMEWTAAVTAGNTWARITSGSSGINSGSIIIAAEANTEDSPRTAVITVTAPDAAGSPKTITVYQAAQSPVLTVLPDIRRAGSGYSTASFEVSNSGGGTMEWNAEVTSGDSWIRITSGSGGTNGGTIEVSIDGNPTNSDRSGIITITAEDETGNTKTVTIFQEGGQSILSLSPENQLVGFNETITAFEVSNIGVGTLNWSVEMTAGNSWAHILSGTGGSGSGQIRISVDANPDNQFREAVIAVTNLDSDDSPQTVSITQSANKPVLSVNRTLQNVPFKGGTITFDVSNHGGGTMRWSSSMTSGASWARIVDGANGSNNGTISLEVDPNWGNQRNATLTIKADEAISTLITLAVVQAAKTAELEIGPEIQNVDFEATTVSFGVSKSGVGTISWSAEVTAGLSWVHITSGTTGNNEGIITALVDKNNGTPRTAVITVISTDSTASPTTLMIRQDIANGISSQGAENRLTVYPNPTVGQCFVEIGEFTGEPEKLEIFNMMGQLESFQSIVQEKTMVDLSGLQQGIYLFRITAGDNRISQRRVVKN